MKGEDGFGFAGEWGTELAVSLGSVIDRLCDSEQVTYPLWACSLICMRG